MKYIKFFEEYKGGVDQVALVLTHMMEEEGIEGYHKSSFFKSTKDLTVYVYDSENGEKTPNFESYEEMLEDVDSSLRIRPIFSDYLSDLLFDEGEGAFVVWRGEAVEAVDSWLWEVYSDISVDVEGEGDEPLTYYGHPGEVALFYTEDGYCYFHGYVWTLFECMGLDKEDITSIIEGFVGKWGVKDSVIIKCI